MDLRPVKHGTLNAGGLRIFELVSTNQKAFHCLLITIELLSAAVTIAQSTSTTARHSQPLLLLLTAVPLLLLLPVKLSRLLWLICRQRNCRQGKCVDKKSVTGETANEHLLHVPAPVYDWRLISTKLGSVSNYLWQNRSVKRRNWLNQPISVDQCRRALGLLCVLLITVPTCDGGPTPAAQPVATSGGSSSYLSPPLVCSACQRDRYMGTNDIDMNKMRLATNRPAASCDQTDDIVCDRDHDICVTVTMDMGKALGWWITMGCGHSADYGTSLIAYDEPKCRTTMTEQRDIWYDPNYGGQKQSESRQVPQTICICSGDRCNGAGRPSLPRQPLLLLLLTLLTFIYNNYLTAVTTPVLLSS